MGEAETNPLPPPVLLAAGGVFGFDFFDELRRPRILFSGMLQNLGNIVGNLHFFAALNLVAFPVDDTNTSSLYSWLSLNSLIFTIFLPSAGGLLFVAAIRAPSFLVGGSRSREGRAGFDANHVLFHQALGYLSRFPSAGTTLVQRIFAISQLLDDMLETATGDFRLSVGMGAQHEGAVHR